MRVLVYSSVFYPAVGGVETVAEVLCEQFVLQGLRVRLCTTTAGGGNRNFVFEVIRRPSWWQLIQLFRWADVVLYANVNMKGLYPLLFAPRPVVITHQGRYESKFGHFDFRPWMKQIIARLATNIACSRAIADHLGGRAVVIPNPYDDATFKTFDEINRDTDLVFLGRLVSDKGVDLLLLALGILRERGMKPRLTIIGTGPELPDLKQLAASLEISEQISFVGQMTGDELAACLNKHKVMVVPSRWNEPFGIVAVEGIACGCVVIGSRGGGLADAIGPCGVTFENGNTAQLAACISDLLSDMKTLEQFRSLFHKHLLLHRKEAVAKEFIKVLDRALTA